MLYHSLGSTCRYCALGIATPARSGVHEGECTMGPIRCVYISFKTVENLSYNDAENVSDEYFVILFLNTTPRIGTSLSCPRSSSPFLAAFLYSFLCSCDNCLQIFDTSLYLSSFFWLLLVVTKENTDTNEDRGTGRLGDGRRWAGDGSQDAVLSGATPAALKQVGSLPATPTPPTATPQPQRRTYTQTHTYTETHRHTHTQRHTHTHTHTHTRTRTRSRTRTSNMTLMKSRDESSLSKHILSISLLSVCVLNLSTHPLVPIGYRKAPEHLSGKPASGHQRPVALGQSEGRDAFPAPPESPGERVQWHVREPARPIRPGEGTKT